MPFPGCSYHGDTQEQVVQIRNTSVRDCFKTRLSSKQNKRKRSAQHHSVDEPCPPAFLPGGSQHISPCVLAPVDGNRGWRDVKGRGGDRKTATATSLLSPRSRECGPAPGWLSVDAEMDTSNVDIDRAGSQMPAA